MKLSKATIEKRWSLGIQCAKGQKFRDRQKIKDQRSKDFVVDAINANAKLDI